MIATEMMGVTQMNIPRVVWIWHVIEVNVGINEGLLQQNPFQHHWVENRHHPRWSFLLFMFTLKLLRFALIRSQDMMFESPASLQ